MDHETPEGMVCYRQRKNACSAKPKNAHAVARATAFKILEKYYHQYNIPVIVYAPLVKMLEISIANRK